MGEFNFVGNEREIKSLGIRGAMGGILINETKSEFVVSLPSLLLTFRRM